MKALGLAMVASGFVVMVGALFVPDAWIRDAFPAVLAAHCLSLLAAFVGTAILLRGRGH